MKGESQNQHPAPSLAVRAVPPPVHRVPALRPLVLGMLRWGMGFGVKAGRELVVFGMLKLFKIFHQQLGCIQSPAHTHRGAQGIL